MPESLTDEQLAEIRERVDAATVTVGDVGYYRADVPELLDEIERLKAENKVLRKEIKMDRLVELLRHA